MWDNRCKIAVSGVGYSKVTRSAEIPLAAHALTAVKEAVADRAWDVRHRRTGDLSGTAGNRTRGGGRHLRCVRQLHDGDAEAAQPDMAHPGGNHQHRWRRAAGGECLARRRVQIRGCVAGNAQPARHLSEPSGAYAPGATQFTAPYGFGGPGQGMAVAYTRWLEQNNQSREKMATLAVTQRMHTQHNPHAYFYGTPLTREDYFASRMVAYPFCLFDCDIPVQGAVAIVLTTADRARDLKPKPAYLAGYGQRLHFEVAGRIGSLSSYMEGGSSSAKLTWERSGFSPKDVDVAQIYDGFSASVIYGLESYGFCKEGEALDFIQDGRIELDGELPLNTFGGSLGTGRIHGLWHIIEGALQASGRAGSRQVKDANVSFVGASAPIVTGTTFIFVREPY